LISWYFDSHVVGAHIGGLPLCAKRLFDGMLFLKKTGNYIFTENVLRIHCSLARHVARLHRLGVKFVSSN